jgi:hypothetical protein
MAIQQEGRRTSDGERESVERLPDPAAPKRSGDSANRLDELGLS